MEKPTVKFDFTVYKKGCCYEKNNLSRNKHGIDSGFTACRIRATAHAQSERISIL
jgi:hypothetical protein